MNAILLSRILSGGVLALIALTGAGFYFSSQLLTDAVIATEHAKTDTLISSENIAQLKRLENELNQKAEVRARAEQIISESKQYLYQDQIVRDVNAYAAIAGVQITAINFELATAQNSTATGTPSKAQAIPGVKVLNARVSLKTPINFDNFLRFLKATEQNLTKMQVTGVNMTPDDKDRNAISNPVVGLQIYVRAQ